MSIEHADGVPWTRKHDLPGTPHLARVDRIWYPTSLAEVIELCRDRPRKQRMQAAGSHWALSDAAVSDSAFVETHAPDDVHGALGRTLHDVVPSALSKQMIDHLARAKPPAFGKDPVGEDPGMYLVHIESGKRVYQLYAELDVGDDEVPGSLARLLADKHRNPGYLGPWAFQTLGGAGGQTVFGALTTGTHGGDHRLPPIADAVMAMHLVVDGGRQLWIERSPVKGQPVLTDDARLHELYDKLGPFEIIRDDELFNAVLICAGRFGIVYSLVLRAVRQYSLHEERRLSNWSAVKGAIASNSGLYDRRFLQIVVAVSPIANFAENRCAITKRWLVPAAMAPNGQPAGRAERRGAYERDGATGALAFKQAGRNHPYNPDPAHPGASLPPTFLSTACANAHFFTGVVEAAIDEFKQFIDENIVGGTLAVILIPGAGGLVVALLPFLLLALALLKGLLDMLRNNPETRLGQALDDLRKVLLSSTDPQQRAAGILIWQDIALRLFETMQAPRDYEAISYAVMDGHDYRDRSCEGNAESIEVFFDAASPNLITFVDAVLAYEVQQQKAYGFAFVGYLSLRFVGKTGGLLGMERFDRTCAVEISGLKDVKGTKELIDYASGFARNPNIGGILHWGQRNDCSMAEIQSRFGDGPIFQSGPLATWRGALAQLTENGRRDGFSSVYTRRMGLEVVTPRVSPAWVEGAAVAGQPLNIAWDCSENPPWARVDIRIITPSGPGPTVLSLGLTSKGVISPAAQVGTYHVQISVYATLNGETRRRSVWMSVVVPP